MLADGLLTASSDFVAFFFFLSSLQMMKRNLATAGLSQLAHVIFAEDGFVPSAL